MSNLPDFQTTILLFSFDDDAETIDEIPLPDPDERPDLEAITCRGQEGWRS